MPPSRLCRPDRRLRLAAGLLTLLLAAGLLAACGGGSGGGVTALQPGTAAETTLELAMAEFTFTPAATTVAARTNVRFVFPNNGQVLHEAVVGTAADNEAMATNRSEAPDLPGVRVAPGATGELVLRFDEPGTYVVGCHELGHWAAGQKATVTVT